MKKENYFPRKPGEEPFEPPFTSGVNQEPLKEGEAYLTCAGCGKFLGIIKAVGSDKSHGLCPKCGAKATAEAEALRKKLEEGKK